MRTLYISHNGLTEPLGHAQVLPYLIGLARHGVAVEIISFEAADSSAFALSSVAKRLHGEGIRWQAIRRSPSHALPRKVWEAGSAVVLGLLAALRRRPDIVHARSYLPAAAAEVVARFAPRARMLFDVRGMLADEAADGGGWRRGGPRYRMVKLYERYLFGQAGGIVVLTDTLRKLLRAELLVPQATPIEVIPCCVDEAPFHAGARHRERMRAELGLGARPIAVYSGTLGSWYKAKEMARFVGLVRRELPDLAFLVLTLADPSDLVKAAHAEGLADADVVVRRVAPLDMPASLSVGDLGLSFIEPCFSKLGSSPTKVGEYLAAGLPVVVNAGVGDQDALAADRDACVVLPSFSRGSLEAGAQRAAAILRRPHSSRAASAKAAAQARFSLADVGVPRYLSLYEAMCSAPHGTPR